MGDGAQGLILGEVGMQRVDAHGKVAKGDDEGVEDIPGPAWVAVYMRVIGCAM